MISTVQSVLNKTKQKRLVDKCPVTVFTGLPPTDPMKTIDGRIDGVQKAKNLDSVRAAQLLGASRTHEALDGIKKRPKSYPQGSESWPSISTTRGLDFSLKFLTWVILC